jgi:hypothetical protein
MPVRRKKSARASQFRPPLPPALGVYEGAEWGAPSLDGTGSGWEAQHRAAYQRWQQAGRDWLDQFGHLPVDLVSVPDDEPFCGEFGDHECRGAECPRWPGAA